RSPRLSIPGAGCVWLRFWCSGSALDELLQLSASVQLIDDVAAAHQLAPNIQLRERGPLAVLLHPVAQRLILEDVDVLEGHLKALQDVDDLRREAALRKQSAALHEQHDLVLVDGGLDLLE